MSQQIQSVRGMRDVLPEQSAAWLKLENIMRDLMAAYSYREMRTPILERTELFSRGIGEVTDVVEKEMYTFADRSGDSLTLRPESTASCVRAGLQHGLFNAGPQRIFYCGPQFRHERPQRGRYRQFWQIGAEAWGIPGPWVEAELILLSARFWQKLGLTDYVSLQINTLGTPDDRVAHRAALIAYFQTHIDVLDDDARRRMHSNPLRVLDSKNPQMQALIESAPKLFDYLCDESKAHFQRLQSLLNEAGVAFTINQRLVRGLDYYWHSVFEWVTDRLGAQATVCGGGRYDGLVGELGGKTGPAVGWAMGMERLLELMEEVLGPAAAQTPHAYLIAVGDSAQLHALTLAERLRSTLPGLRLQAHGSAASFKAQFKGAHRSGAEVALVIAQAELEAGEVGIKALRVDGAQRCVKWEQLIVELAALIDEEQMA